MAVLRPGRDFERDLPMSEYALVSRSTLRRRFGFDVIVAERDSHLYQTCVEFLAGSATSRAGAKDSCA